MDRELAVSDVLTMNQIINRSSLDASFETTLLAALAGISLLLAAVGLFGVLAYLVTQRRTETNQSLLTWLRQMPEAAKPAAMPV